MPTIHEAMKAPTRRIYGKTYITYTDPLTSSAVDSLTASSTAYNSQLEQIRFPYSIDTHRYFTLYDNNLSGSYVVSDSNSHVGWTSSILSDSSGYFSQQPYVLLEFASAPIVRIELDFDEARDNIAVNFTITFTRVGGNTIEHVVTDNTLAHYLFEPNEPLGDITAIRVTIGRTKRPNSPATILAVSTSSSFLYVGYQDASNLISMELLEELTYEDDIEALGGMSANEITVVLDNTNKDFNINNSNSPVSKQLRRNRKIEPYLGADLGSGAITWYPLGVFWSYSWEVPTGSLTASVTGFDTIGLLDLTTFSDHQVLTNRSLGYLIDYVLTDAKKVLKFLDWEVADELYDVVIPYAWFAYGSHAAALRKISQCYPMHIYCNRQGSIVAAPQRIQREDVVDTWSDSTNVIDKSYSSLYTVLPNTVNVTVISPALKADTELVSDELVFNISSVPTRTLTFSSTYYSDLRVDVDCDDTVSVTHTVYSWGIVLTFTGTGNVRAIKCYGTALDKSNTAIISQTDEASILSNGVVTRDIAADFIQTTELGLYLADRLFSLSAFDNYDVEVTYRGDIALTINDPILLLDGISPSDKYTIKRHQLSWDGSLSGTADLNT